MQSSALSKAFKKKKVLVTGHTGFKGAWLALWLKQLGAQVTGFALPPEHPSLFEACRLTQVIDSRFGDVRDLNALEGIMREVEPEVVFHLASQALVSRAYQDPIETISTNVMGTANVLEAIRRLGSRVKVCQVVTSDKCYDNQELDRPLTEGDPMGGTHPYSASKGCAELLSTAFRQSFFSKGNLSLSSVRAGNVIGGGDWSQDRLVPDCVRALAKGEVIELRRPKAQRPWQYILDVLSGYLTLAAMQGRDPRGFSEAWNFGPDMAESLTVEDMTRKVVAAWGSGNWVSLPQVSKQRFREENILRLDATKAHQRLGWRPIFSADETIRRTVEWYRKFLSPSPSDALDACQREIKFYEDCLREREPAWTN